MVIYHVVALSLNGLDDSIVSGNVRFNLQRDRSVDVERAGVIEEIDMDLVVETCLTYFFALGVFLSLCILRNLATKCTKG